MVTVISSCKNRLQEPLSERAVVAYRALPAPAGADALRLHDGRLAAGGIDRDHGSLQLDAVEQAGQGRDLVAPWPCTAPGPRSAPPGRRRAPSKSSRAAFMAVSGVPQAALRAGRCRGTGWFRPGAVTAETKPKHSSSESTTDQFIEFRTASRVSDTEIEADRALYLPNSSWLPITFV